MRLLQFLKSNIVLVITVIVGFLLRLGAAFADPFLHAWDERFHALVARNMMDKPLKPMLYARHVMHYTDTHWTFAGLWLHKQPLFMWQMALSMKLFGVSEYAMRLPGAIMGTLTIIFVYRISLLLTRDKFTSLVAAMLMCCSHYQLELISGRRGLDQNDIAFCFYVIASIWAYCEYVAMPKWQWALLAGVLSGGAILNKWLSGLLVFLGWGVFALIATFKKDWKKTGHFIIALLACLVVFLPWQFYILHNYPDVAKPEYAYNTAHLTVAVEGHDGDCDYYYRYFADYFGQWLWWLLFPGLIIFIVKIFRGYQKQIGVSIFLYTAFTYVFFAFIVATKMPSFVFIVAPLGVLFIAIFIGWVCQFITKARWLKIPVVAACLFYALDPVGIVDSFNYDKDARAAAYNTHIYKHLGEKLPANIGVVFNTPHVGGIDIMFYNKRLTAYSWLVLEDELKLFEQQRLPIAVFDKGGADTLPGYIRSYPYLYIIPEELK